MTSPYAELGGEYFVRSLQEFIRSTERVTNELTFEKAELEARVSGLESAIAAKDIVIKEYLRRIALLEYALRRTGRPSVRGKSSVVVSTPPQEDHDTDRRISGKDLVKMYLEELGDLTMPDMERNSDQETLEESNPDLDEPIGEWTHLVTVRASLGASRGLALVGGSSGSASLLLVGTEEGVVKAWSEEDLTKLEMGEIDVKNVCLNQNVFNPHIVARFHRLSVTCVSSHENHVLTGDAAGSIGIWSVNNSLVRKSELYPASEVSTGISLDRRLENLHAGRINSVDWLGSSGVVSVGTDQRLVVSNLDGAAQVVDLSSVATSVKYLPDSGLIACGSADGVLRIVDPQTGKLVQELSYGAGISGISVAESLIAFCQFDGNISLLDYRSNSVVNQKSESLFTCLGLSAPRLVLGDLQGTVSMWEMRKLGGGPSQTWTKSHSAVGGEGVTDIQFSDSGTSFASSGADGKINVYRKL